jgi:Domain of unknown function (DUF4406)
MKLYLAGPMAGYKDFNFPAFHKAAAELRAMGNDVFSPAEKDIEQHGDVFQGEGDAKLLQETTKFSLREALALDLNYICREADGIALMLGWERSKGANAENATALALGLKRIFQDIEGNWVGVGQ